MGTVRRLLKGLARRVFGKRLLPPAPYATGSTYMAHGGQGQWYAPVQVTAHTIGRLATGFGAQAEVSRIINLLEVDDYLGFVQSYCEAGRQRYGDEWQFADILTALWAAVRVLRPDHYLEIGVRQGRSMAVVAGTVPDCNIVGFDLWVPDYAGMPNPGPEFVAQQLRKVGHRGQLELISGDSHITVKDYFRQHPDLFFELITVDGDHSKRGAIEDLRDVLPRLKVGGVLVFDDLTNPVHQYLAGVWDHEVGRQPQLRTWTYRELGYGVGIALRVA